MATVVLEGVCKTYLGDKGREVVAVEDLNLVIEDREFIVLLGPSGCGKSTTLRMVAGLEEISRGNILINGRKVNDVPPKDRDIAMVFQNYALYPHMTIRRNLAFGLELRKFPRDEIDRRVGEAAAILGLTDEMLERRPKALSGGQRQRVAVGRAIVRKPQAFLFDEPLSNLDAKMRVQMRTEISKLHTRLATTMIYVTHDQVEAMTMGDRIVVMKDGRILQVAKPLEIYNRPANAFVAGFIGSPPMNFFEGTLVEEAGRLWFCENAREGRSPIRLEPIGEQAKKLTGHAGRPIIFGVRPEDLDDARHGRPSRPEHAFAAAVEVIEPMGAETFLYLHTGSHAFIVRSPSQMETAEEQKIDLTVNMAKAHFFESPDKARFRKANGEFDQDRWQAAATLLV
jgi:multiple sugar transport system ATP-binding protein